MIAVVVLLVRDATFCRKCYAVVALNVKNGSNSASREWIKSLLVEMGVSSYLTKLTESYFSERRMRDLRNKPSQQEYHRVQ